MLELASLTKRFGSSTAVRDLSLSCGPGAVIGLLGPNGAGKTTTIRMAVGALAPDRGRVTISGFESLAEIGAAAKTTKKNWNETRLYEAAIVSG
ncbi:MAG: ATP-binding cassette domain-containing protein, partial [Planctomycetota bacterium]